MEKLTGWLDDPHVVVLDIFNGIGKTMNVLDLDDFLNLTILRNLKRTALGLRGISNSGLPLSGGSVKDAAMQGLCKVNMQYMQCGAT